MDDLLTQLLNSTKLLETRLTEISLVMARIAGNPVPSTNGHSPPSFAPLINNLTDKETAILNLLKEGKSVVDIASELALSKRTVEAHRYNIQKKLNLVTVKDLKRVVIPWLLSNH